MDFFKKFTSNFKTKPITNVRFVVEYTVSFIAALTFMAVIMYLVPLLGSEAMAISAVCVMFAVYFYLLARPFVRRWYAITGKSDFFTIYFVSFFAVIPPISFLFVIPLAFPFKERTEMRIATHKKVS